MIPEMISKEGKQIRRGDVLLNHETGYSGVVVELNDKIGWQPAEGSAMNMAVQTSRGCKTIGNKWDSYSHVPLADQSYEERYVSWMNRPFSHEREDISEDTDLAIDGIIALLPDPINWESGPWPDSLEIALSMLAYHMQDKEDAYQKLLGAPLESTLSAGLARISSVLFSDEHVELSKMIDLFVDKAKELEALNAKEAKC